MGIFLRHSWNVKPPRWGSFADVMYAIKVNAEKIYDCNPDNDVLIMPGFWGLPLLDYSGYNNHGTNHGATYKDGSLDFDGAHYVDCGNSNDLTPSNLTISTWLNHDYKTDYDDILGKWETDVGGYGFAYSGDKYLMWVANPNVYSYSSSVIEVGVWTNVVVEIPGTVITYYINGALDTSLDKGTTIKATTNDFNIGGHARYGDHFRGSILEVRITKAVHTADQIALFHDCPWDLYRSVARPIWSIPAVGGDVTITKTDSLINFIDLGRLNLQKIQQDNLYSIIDSWKLEINKIIIDKLLGDFKDSKVKIQDKKEIDSLINLQELFLKKKIQIFEDSISILSDDYIAQITGITRKVLQDSIILLDIITKKEEKRFVERLEILLDIITKKEEKINVDNLSKLADISTKRLTKLTSEELNFYEIYGKELSKTNFDSIVGISDIKYFSNIKTVGDVLNSLTDIFTKTLEKINTDDFIISDTFTASIVIITKLLLYLLTDIKDFSGRESDIKDFSGRESDIKGH